MRTDRQRLRNFKGELQPELHVYYLRNLTSRAGELVSSEEEIREICVRISLAPTQDEFKAALTELKIAIRDHVSTSDALGIHLVSNNSKLAKDRKEGTQG